MLQHVYYTAKDFACLILPALPATVPFLEEDGSNWATFTPHFGEAIQTICQWGYVDGTIMHPVPKDPAHPTNAESAAIKEWDCEDAIIQCRLTARVPETIETFLIEVNCQTVKACWDRLTEKLGQPGPEDTRKEEELIEEAPTATGRGSGRRRRRGKRHSCREEGHRARDCCAPKEEPATVPAAQELSGAAEQPESSPVHTTLRGRDVR